MSETVIMEFCIEDGIITEVREYYPAKKLSRLLAIWPRDIEDAVARVANTPVGGKDET